MFKKLFFRNKKPLVSPTKDTTITPDSAASWAARVNAAQPGELASTLKSCVAQYDNSALALDSLLGQVNSVARAILQLHFDRAVTNANEVNWLDVATLGFTAKIRSQAVQHINDPTQLKTLLNQLKGKDNKTYRQIKARLALQADEKKQAELRQHKIESLILSIEQLAQSAYEPMYKAKVTGLTSQWQQLAVKEDQAQHKFDQARSACLEKVRQEEQAQQQAVEAVAPTLASSSHEPKPLPADALQKVSNAQSSEDTVVPSSVIKSLSTQLHALFSASDVPSQDSLSQLQSQLQESRQQWRELNHAGVVTTPLQTEFNQIEEALSKSIALFTWLLEQDMNVLQLNEGMATLAHESIKHIEQCLQSVSAAYGTLPDVWQASVQAIEAYHRQRNAQVQQQIRGLKKQIRRCQSAIDEGSIRKASGIYKSLEASMNEALGAIPNHLVSQIEALSAQIDKLKDWKSYAVLPKKEALIERMAALIQVSMNPEEKAQQIRAMQDEWKQLSQGLFNQHQDLWQRFNALAQQAYEPCKDYYEQQNALKALNLAKRQEVVNSLQTYIDLVDWSNVNIKEVEEALLLARQDWQRFQPVDYRANKSLQQEYNALYQQCLGKIETAQTPVINTKTYLIQQAKALLTSDDIAAAIEQMKALQGQWKSAGYLMHKTERELWKEFRDACDQLFERYRQYKQAMQDDVGVIKKKAESIIQSIEQLPVVEGERAAFDQLIGAYETLEEMPRSLSVALNKRFQKACQHYLHALERQTHAQEEQAWQALIHWVRQARYGRLSTEELQAQWHQLKERPLGSDRLIQCMSTWQEPAQTENEQRLLEQTIDLEILTGCESPSEDSRLRMAIQVKGLSEGIGVNVTSKRINDAVIAWLAIGSVNPTLYAQYETRMLHARSSWHKNIK